MLFQHTLQTCGPQLGVAPSLWSVGRTSNVGRTFWLSQIGGGEILESSVWRSGVLFHV